MRSAVRRITIIDPVVDPVGVAESYPLIVEGLDAGPPTVELLAVDERDALRVGQRRKRVAEPARRTFAQDARVELRDHLSE